MRREAMQHSANSDALDRHPDRVWPVLRLPKPVLIAPQEA
jgi:hypothetical protein